MQPILYTREFNFSLSCFWIFPAYKYIFSFGLFKWWIFPAYKNPLFMAIICKLLLVSWTFDTISNGFRFLIAENLGSVGQRAAKLPFIRLWEWFERGRTRIRADWFEWGWGCAADLFLRPPTLKAGNFEAL